MIAALLVSLAAPQSAVEAERAFAAMAQSNGQWTAFRSFAAPDAILFSDGPRNAHDLLDGLPDPRVSVAWWPGFSWVSCDGDLAVNTGPTLRDGGRKHGSFTTVWQRQHDGNWKWLADNGRDMPETVPARENPLVRKARCAAGPFAAERAVISSGVMHQWEGEQAGFGLDGRKLPEARAIISEGSARDGTLHWRYSTFPGFGEDAFGLSVWMWNGKAHELVLHEISGVAKR